MEGSTGLGFWGQAIFKIYCMFQFYNFERVLNLYFLHNFIYSCLIGLAVAIATAEKGPGSIPGLGKVLLGFYISNFSVTVTESGFVPG